MALHKLKEFRVPKTLQEAIAFLRGSDDAERLAARIVRLQKRIAA